MLYTFQSIIEQDYCVITYFVHLIRIFRLFRWHILFHHLFQFTDESGNRFKILQSSQIYVQDILILTSTGR